MPRAIAIRMYCVNLFDIVLPQSVSGSSSLADFKADATRFKDKYRQGQRKAPFAKMFTLWNALAPTSLICIAQIHHAAACAFLARHCIKNSHIDGRKP